MLARWRDAQEGTLLLWAPVGFACGIAWYFAQSLEPSVLPLATAAACATTLALGLRRHLLWRVLPILLCLATLGALAAKVQTEGHRAPVLTQDYRGPVIGRLIGLDRSERNRLRLLLDQVELPGLSPTPERVRIVLNRPIPESSLFAGARLMTTASLGPPPEPVEPDGFDFRRHAWFLRLGAIGFATEPVVLSRPRAPPAGDMMLYDLRLRLSQGIRAAMPGRAGGFAAAILTGERSGVDPEALEDLRASNLAHLLAISGLHMGLLCGAVFFAVRLALILLPRLGPRLPAKKIAAATALAAGAAYLALSGASVATQRAFIMASVVLIAVCADRPALTLRGVAVAALIVLTLRPSALMGPGFQMSFAATVALIAGYGALRDQPLWLRLNGWRGGILRGGTGLVLTALIAGIATAPFSAFHFNQLTSYGLIANILAVPAMGLLVMPAALVALAGFPFGLEGAGLIVMEFGIEHILTVADRVASLDGAVRPVPTGPPWVLGTLASGGVILAALRSTPRLVGTVPIAAALIGWGLSDRPLILVAPEGKLVGILGPEGRQISTARGQGFAARVWLENDGDRAVQRAAATRPSNLPVTLWTRSDPPPPAICKPGLLLIAPKAVSVPAGPCQILDAEGLARNGAHAFTDGKMLATPRTTRAATGQRPWTTASNRPQR